MNTLLLYYILVIIARCGPDSWLLYTYSVKESGAWIQLQVMHMPISAVGLLITDDKVQTAAVLRLVAPLCHSCTQVLSVWLQYAYIIILCMFSIVYRYATHGMVYPAKEMLVNTWAMPLLIATSYSAHLQQ